MFFSCEFARKSFFGEALTLFGVGHFGRFWVVIFCLGSVGKLEIVLGAWETANFCSNQGKLSHFKKIHENQPLFLFSPYSGISQECNTLTKDNVSGEDCPRLGCYNSTSNHMGC